MMVSHMRGLFKNVRGSMDFDPDNPAGAAAVEATINSAGIWTGDDERGGHGRTINPDTGVQYSVTPTRTYDTAAGPCRAFATEAIIGGNRETVFGTACRQVMN